MAWTGLRYPWKFRPSITDEQKRLIQAKGVPPELEGMDSDVFEVLINAMGAASDYGYDPENDYREQYSFLLLMKYNSLPIFMRPNFHNSRS